MVRRGSKDKARRSLFSASWMRVPLIEQVVLLLCRWPTDVPVAESTEGSAWRGRIVVNWHSRLPTQFEPSELLLASPIKSLRVLLERLSRANPHDRAQVQRMILGKKSNKSWNTKQVNCVMKSPAINAQGRRAIRHRLRLFLGARARQTFTAPLCIGAAHPWTLLRRRARRPPGPSRLNCGHAENANSPVGDLSRETRCPDPRP